MWKLIDDDGAVKTEATSIAGIGVLVRTIGGSHMAIVFVPGAQLYTDSDGKTKIVGAGK